MKFDSVWLFPERDNTFQKELKFVLAWFFSEIDNAFQIMQESKH